MKKSKLIITLLLSVTLYGCSMNKENNEQQTEYTQMNEEKQGSAEAENTEKENTAAETGSETDGLTIPEIEITAPTKEEVLAAREQVLEGMSTEEIERLKENIKVANLQMESAYLYENIFEKLEDTESLYWNYFDEKGEIQTGWTYDGTPVTVYNRFDAGNFIELLEEMKETVKNENLQDDLGKMIDETALAAETHEMEHAYHIYQLLHDMDYYLLRYGLEDVGKYVRDVSIIAKYYGVLSVYASLQDSGANVVAVPGRR